MSEVTVHALRAEAQILEQFILSQSFASFESVFKGEYDTALEKILEFIPQTKGDELEREQAIGSAHWLKSAFKFFPEYLERLKQQINEREYPKGEE